MKLLKLAVFSTLYSNARATSIPTKKICKDCIHFIGDKIECRKFSDTNIITGRVTYHSAKDVRKDEKMCGEDANHFEENNFKIITVPYYYLKENWAILMIVGGFYWYALLLYNIL
jgi:hypothetical protein